MFKHELSNIVKNTIIKSQDEGLIPRVALPEVLIEHPQNTGHGDFASSIALKLSRAARTNPADIAQTIVNNLPTIDGIEKISIAPPGFINFFLEDDWVRRQIDTILSQKDNYGNLTIGQNIKVLLEFVSVNPTGPLHVGHGRGAVLGSALASVLTAAGFEVKKEYYINDAGNQMETFFNSLYARYMQARNQPSKMPEDGYRGQYLIEIAEQIAKEEGGGHPGPDDPPKNLQEVGENGYKIIMATLEADLKRLGVEFDEWFSEQSLFDSGEFEKVMSLLKDTTHVTEREGASWFVSTDLGEDKDNVLIRSNGTPTYFASDIAYHYNKFIERGFNRAINIWGADHQGHVSRMEAAMDSLGIPSENLKILIAQMVSLRRGDIQVKISKRTGDIITLEELMNEVGRDVCRFFFLSRSADSQMDFDLELAKKESMDNPVYYVQYGYARIAGILRLAKEKGVDFSSGDVSLIVTDDELELVKKLLLFPEIIHQIAGTLEPHHLCYYAQNLATAFHNFYEKCRVVTDDKPLTLARLKLVEATRIVMARTLSLMGMQLLEKM